MKERKWFMRISSSEFLHILRERKAYLEEMLFDINNQRTLLKTKSNYGDTKKIDQQKKNVPSYRIRVQKHGKGYQYYLRENKKDTSGKYLKKEQEFQAQQILQNEYYEKSLQIIQQELLLLNKYLDKNVPTKLMDYYENLNEGRKIMINPLEIDDETYIKAWMSMPYEGKGFRLDEPEFYTQNLERVRSKSEIIIADVLVRYHIPYRYECPIFMQGMGKIYPDFTVLNVRTRKELYWEHFGLIDNEEYRERAMRKMAIYEENGIYLGDKLIVTCESLKQPLNMKDLERKIQKFLM